MRALVTGGAGFIGAHVAKHLLAGGHEVMVLDNLTGGWADNVPEGAAFRKVELADYGQTQAWYRLFAPDVVYHLAAYAAEGLSHWIRRFNYQNNVQASANLINCALKFGCDRFVFTSSMGVYGEQHPPFTEEMIPAPVDPYGIAKYAVEMDLQAAAETHDLNWTVIRPHNVYGPGQNLGDPYRNVVGIFMRQRLEGKPFTVFGDGTQTRAFSHINDVAPVIAAAGFDPAARNQVFNVGGDTVYTINQLAAAVGPDHPIDHLPARHEVKHAWCDHEKAKRLLNFNSHVELEAGVADMWEWAQTVGVRWSQTPDIEVDDRLPDVWRR